MEDDMPRTEALERGAAREALFSPARHRRVASSPSRGLQRPRLRRAARSSSDLGYLRLWLAAAALRAHEARRRMIRVAAL